MTARRVRRVVLGYLVSGVALTLYRVAAFGADGESRWTRYGRPRKRAVAWHVK